MSLTMARDSLAVSVWFDRPSFATGLSPPGSPGPSGLTADAAPERMGRPDEYAAGGRHHREPDAQRWDHPPRRERRHRSVRRGGRDQVVGGAIEDPGQPAGTGTAGVYPESRSTTDVAPGS
jgi:hypothetical protein